MSSPAVPEPETPDVPGLTRTLLEAIRRALPDPQVLMGEITGVNIEDASANVSIGGTEAVTIPSLGPGFGLEITAFGNLLIGRQVWLLRIDGVLGIVGTTQGS